MYFTVGFFSLFVSLILKTNLVNSQSVVNDAKIDGKELRCLVCEASLRELTKAVNQLDPSKTVDVGGHRLDVDGNYRSKAVPQTKSEMHLSEIVENVCNKMDDYVRGLWKSNGTLTLFKMITEDGKMNPTMSEVNLVQDEDLNKSVKYICESIMSEYEESIIKHYINEETNIYQRFCIDESKICDKKIKPDNSLNKEL